MKALRFLRRAGSRLSLAALCIIAACTARADDAALTLNTADQPPYSTKDDSGLYDIIIKTACARLGLTVRINHLPSARSIENADLGIDDGEYARIDSIGERYHNLVMVREKLSDFAFTAFAGNETIRLGSWSDLAAYHVAYIRGWKIYETKVREARSVITAVDEAELFDLLEQGRVDLVLYERLRGMDFLKRTGKQGIYALEPPLAVREMYLFLHRKHLKTAQELEVVLQEMKASGSYQQIIDSFAR